MWKMLCQEILEHFETEKCRLKTARIPVRGQMESCNLMNQETSCFVAEICASDYVFPATNYRWKDDVAKASWLPKLKSIKRHFALNLFQRYHLQKTDL